MTARASPARSKPARNAEAMAHAPGLACRRFFILIGVLIGMWVGCLAGPTARAQTPPELTPPATKESAERLASLSWEAMEKGDPAKAESLLRRQLKLQPQNFVVYYNLACTRAAQRDPPGAVKLLKEAIELGFCDAYQLRREGVLDAIRQEPEYQRLIDHWDEVLLARRDANLKSARSLFKNGYKEITDERMRVVYRTAFDERSTKDAIAELDRVAAFAETHLFPGLFDPALSQDDAWVTVVLPSKLDFAKWAISLYGPNVSTGNSTVGGAYEHDLKRLVSMDLGATLRHEFLHMLHYRHITRQGQSCPAWVLEGLGCLVEDYDLGPANELVPATSWRTNILKRVEKLGNLPTLEKLAKIPYTPFFSQRPLLNYAAARGEFMFLFSQGKLLEWSKAFDKTHRDDPSGVLAYQQVLGSDDPIELHKRWREFVRGLPAVPEEIRAGAASLGLELDAGAGEGPIVTSFDRRRGAGGLRLGDVITSIDAKPVRDLAELVRVLSGYKPGDTVEIAYRRAKLVGTSKLQLVAKR